MAKRQPKPKTETPTESSSPPPSPQAAVMAVSMPIPTTEMWEIDRLRPDPLNYRKHTTEQLRHLRASLRKRQWRKPVVARPSDGRIIAGHGIVEAARLEGWTHIPVWPWECTDAEGRAYLVADNELSRGGLVDDNQETLAKLLAEIKAVEGNLEGIGWDASELDSLIRDLRHSGTATKPGDGDEAPEPRHREPSRSVVGEVYDLGPHRLACGDACDPAVWTALMVGAHAACVWTDPPYGVAYVGGTADKMTLENDDLDEAALETLLASSLGHALQHTAPGGAWYVAAPGGPLFLAFGKVLHALKVWRQTLVWVKSSIVLGRSDYQPRNEMIFHGRKKAAPKRTKKEVEPVVYGWRTGAAHSWQADRKQDTVLEFDKPHRNDVHPTMKLLALIQYCLHNSTEAGALVVDAFGGSGSTLIAAACEGRVARLIELDPHYCDVIRRRWTRWARRQNLDPGTGALDG